MVESMSSARSAKKTVTTTTSKYERSNKKLGIKSKKSIATAKVQDQKAKKKYINSQWRFDATMSLWEWQNEKYNSQFGQCSKNQPHTHAASVLLVQRPCFSKSMYCWICSFFSLSLSPRALSLLEKSTFVCVVIHINEWMNPKCKRKWKKSLNVYLFRLLMLYVFSFHSSFFHLWILFF